MIKLVVRYPVSQLASLGSRALEPIRIYVWHRYAVSLLATIGFIGGVN